LANEMKIASFCARIVPADFLMIQKRQDGTNLLSRRVSMVSQN
jgi:hypothetical protein